MQFVKKISLAAIVFMFCASLQAQDLGSAFATSYAHEAKGEYSKAIEEIKKTKDVSYESLMRLGWLYYLNGAHKEAYGFYQKAIAAKPMSIEARLGAVLPLSILENWEEVKKIYEQALEVDSRNSLINYRLGLIYYNQGNYTKAKKYFDSNLNLYPFDYDTVIMSAWVQYQLGNKVEAKTLFKKALLSRPKDASALEGLGLLK